MTLNDANMVYLEIGGIVLSPQKLDRYCIWCTILIPDKKKCQWFKFKRLKNYKGLQFVQIFPFFRVILFLTSKWSDNNFYEMDTKIVESGGSVLVDQKWDAGRDREGCI